MNIPGRITELFRAIDAKDTEAFVSFLTEDADFRYGSAPVVQGKTAVKDVVNQVFEQFESLQHELFNVWEMRDTIVCEGEVTYGRSDAKRVTLPFCNVLHLKDGMIRKYWVYVDPSPLSASS